MANLSALLLLLILPSAAAMGSFQKHAPKSVKLKQLQIKEDLMIALRNSITSMGFGLNLEEINHRLAGTFTALPKMKGGLLDNAAARYLAHSFFRKEFGWLIQGLQVGGAGQDSGAFVNVSVLPNNRNDIPEFLLSILGKKLNRNGCTLNAAVAFVALLRNLIIHEGGTKLKLAYSLNNVGIYDRLSKESLDRVLDSYMVLLASENIGGMDHKQHGLDRTKVHQMWSGFPVMQTFSNDMLGNTAFVLENKKNPFRERSYSFQDATQVMVLMSQEYGKVRNYQCHDLKNALIEMDPGSTGRVSLKHFYAKRTVGPWLLTESQEYLRQLGTLDETAPQLGPQVIIPNYITAVSNCDSPSDYFSICCIYECEDLLNQLEVKIAAPNAKPDQILSLVANMSSGTLDAPRNLSTALVNALGQVAALHDGFVPLHSRLFAQWMHYVFPHECPYPHMMGKLTPVTPSEWQQLKGRTSEATQAEVMEVMRLHIDDAHADGAFMSQWTFDEEMLTSQPANRQKTQLSLGYVKSALQILAFAFGPGAAVVWSYMRFIRAFRSEKKVGDHRV